MISHEAIKKMLEGWAFTKGKRKLVTVLYEEYLRINTDNITLRKELETLKQNLPELEKDRDLWKTNAKEYQRALFNEKEKVTCLTTEISDLKKKKKPNIMNRIIRFFRRTNV